MGFQSNINNLLTQVAIGGRALKYASKEAEAEKKSQELAKASEQEQLKAQQEAERESITSTESKIDEAIRMSVGYTNEDIKKQNASKDLGIDIPNKMPRGVSQKTFDRRQANANAMKEILSKFSQNKEWRDRLEKYSVKDLAKTLNPTIRARGGKK